MTIYALGDYHGHSIQEFLEKETPNSGDLILSTGDFDQVKVIEEFLELKNNLGEDSVIDVGANHDHAILKRRPITSETIRDQDKSFNQLVEDLHSNNSAKNYIEEILDEPIKEFNLGNVRGVLVHGGLDGYIQSFRTPEEIKPLWYRIRTDEDFNKNFDRMAENGYELMIRGHDHRQEYVIKPEESEEIIRGFPQPGDVLEIESGFKYIINHGPWYEGKYITFDEEDEIVEFKQI